MGLIVFLSDPNWDFPFFNRLLKNSIMRAFDLH